MEATVTTTGGRPVGQITGVSLVTLQGVQGTVDFFVNEGRLQRAPDGTYSEGKGNAPVPQLQPDSAIGALCSIYAVLRAVSDLSSALTNAKSSTSRNSLTLKGTQLFPAVVARFQCAPI
jgi:hypothetical protein